MVIQSADPYVVVWRGQSDILVCQDLNPCALEPPFDVLEIHPKVVVSENGESSARCVDGRELLDERVDIKRVERDVVTTKQEYVG